MRLSRWLLLPLVIVLLIVAYIFIVASWNYSTGERAGWVQKLSKKGWLCKTWEGELALVTMPGAIPEKFVFTVADDGIADRINALAGKRVVMHYKQHKFIPSSCLGETEYFISDVSEVSETQHPAAPLPNSPQLNK